MRPDGNFIFIILFLSLVLFVSQEICAQIQVTVLYEVAQGNVAMTSQVGVIDNQYTYGPYGQQRNLNSQKVIYDDDVGYQRLINQTRTPLNIKHNRYGYTGQVLDPSTSLMMLGKFRNYAPGIGRFIQPDTYNSFSKQGINNLNAYVKANPIKFEDPTGHMPGILRRALDSQFLFGDGRYTPAGTLGDIELAVLAAVPELSVADAASVAAFGDDTTTITDSDLELDPDSDLYSDSSVSDASTRAVDFSTARSKERDLLDKVANRISSQWREEFPFHQENEAAEPQNLTLTSQMLVRNRYDKYFATFKFTSKVSLYYVRNFGRDYIDSKGLLDVDDFDARVFEDYRVVKSYLKKNPFNRVNPVGRPSQRVGNVLFGFQKRDMLFRTEQDPVQFVIKRYDNLF